MINNEEKLFYSIDVYLFLRDRFDEAFAKQIINEIEALQIERENKKFDSVDSLEKII